MSSKKVFLLLTLVAGIALPIASVQARVFKNSYIQFNIPDQWACNLYKRAYICRHKVSKSCKVKKITKRCEEQIRRSKEAIIVLAAKEKSPLDSLKAYTQTLSRPKAIQRPQTRVTQSKVIHSKKVKVGGQTWVDGMHLGSELPYYYTRYLAAIRGEVAVLVTFSAHKLFYTKYSTTFFNSIKTMKITANNVAKVSPKEVGNQVLSHPIDLPSDMLNLEGSLAESEPIGGDSSRLLFLTAFLIAAIGIYVWFKGRK